MDHELTDRLEGRILAFIHAELGEGYNGYVAVAVKDGRPTRIMGSGESEGKLRESLKRYKGLLADGGIQIVSCGCDDRLPDCT